MIYNRIISIAGLFLIIVGLIFSLRVLTSDAATNFNQQINYQGRLTATTSIAVSNASYNIRFKLYTVATGGSAIWTETDCFSTNGGTTCTGSGSDNRVSINNGIFSVMLGSTTALTGINFNQTLYLGVEIGGASSTSPTWDGEMTPRKIIGAVPAAMYAGTSSTATTLNGISDTQFIRNDQQNSTSSASTFLNILQTGGGKIAEFFSSATQSVFSILSNGRVGVGSSTPSATLTVQGTTSAATTDLFTVASSSGSSYLTILSGGNVGIGSSTPGSLLSVGGNGYFGGNLTATGTLAVTSTTTTGGLSVGTLSGLLFGTSGVVSAIATSSLGLGSVTSVGLSLPSIFTVSGSPVTSSGTLSATLASQAQNLVFASPNGSSGSPTFRSLVAADIPTLNQNTTGTAANVTGIVAVANGGTGLSTASTSAFFLTNSSGVPFWGTTTPAFTLGGILTGNSQNITGLGTITIGSTTSFASLGVKGIAGTNPFIVASSSNTQMLTLLQNGNFGIGSSTPGSTLSVGGTLSVTGTTTLNYFTVITRADGTAVYLPDQGSAGADAFYLLKYVKDNQTALASSTILVTKSLNLFYSGQFCGLPLVVGGSTTIAPGVVITAPDASQTTCYGESGDYFRFFPSASASPPANATYTFVNKGNIDFSSSQTDNSNLEGSTIPNAGNVIVNFDLGHFYGGGNDVIGGNIGNPTSIVFNVFGSVVDTDAGYRFLNSVGSSAQVTLNLYEGKYGSLLAKSNDTINIYPGSYYTDVSGTTNVNLRSYTTALSGPLGVGSSTPSASLSVKGTAGMNPFVISSSTNAQLLTLLQNGNFGISSSTPGSRLSVGGSGFFGGNLTATGTLTVSATSTLTGLKLTNLSNTVLALDGSGNVIATSSSALGTNYFINSGATTSLTTGSILTALTGTFGTINSTSTTGTSTFVNAATFGGNVGIGTTTPSSPLAVVSRAAGTPILQLYATTSQTADFLDMYDATGTAALLFTTASDNTNGITFQNSAFANPAVRQNRIYTKPGSGVNDLYITGNGSRLYFGQSGATFFALDFANVTTFSNVPARLDLLSFTGGPSDLRCLTTCTEIANGNGDLILYTQSGFITPRQGVNANPPALSFKSFVTDSSAVVSSYPFEYRFDVATTTAHLTSVPTHTRWDVFASTIMTLTNSGRLGIGTTTPNSLLEVSTSSSGTALATFADPAISITNRNTTNNSFATLAFRSQDTNGIASSTAQISGIATSHTAGAISGDLAFLTQNSGVLGERMRILANGNIGIGSTTAASLLTVGGNGYFGGNLTATGTLSITATTTTGGLSVGTLSGLLFGTSGAVSARATSTLNIALTDTSGVLAVNRGGTGTSTAPALNQLLIGNASGGYNYIATSSLGISGGGTNYWTSSGGNIYNNTGTNVGIGNTSPTYLLTIGGSAHIDSSGNALFEQITSNSGADFNGEVQIHGNTDLTLDDKIVLGSNFGSFAWIDSDGSASFAAGGASIDSVGMVTANKGFNSPWTSNLDSIQTFEIHNYNGLWDINQDGSAQLADGAISIAPNGNFDVIGTDSELCIGGCGTGGSFIDSPHWSIDTDGNATFDGKISATGGIDPPYVLYDPHTRAETKDRVLREVPAGKQSGAALFWNSDTKSFEAYIASEDRFVDPFASQFALDATTSAALASSTATTLRADQSFISTIVEAVMAKMSSLFDTVAHFAVEFVTGKLTVGSPAKPTGITLYDTQTGQPYCLQIKNGVALSTPGECSLSSSSDTSATSTDSSISSIPSTSSSGVQSDPAVVPDTASSTSSTESIPESQATTTSATTDATVNPPLVPVDVPSDTSSSPDVVPDTTSTDSTGN